MPGIAIGEQQMLTQETVGRLAEVVGSTYALAVKVHAAHWNLKGAGFLALHGALEQQYRALLIAADVLAERIRAIGQDAPASIRHLLSLGAMGDRPAGSGEAELVRSLRDDHRSISRLCQGAVRVAREAQDETSAQLLVERIREHDTFAWMLTAALGGR